MKTLLLCLFACLLCFAADQPIDFTQILIGLDGKPLVFGGKDSPAMTLADAAVIALESPLDEDKTAPPETKFKLDQLAAKIYKNNKAILTVEEIATIKTRIGKTPWQSYTILGAAWRLLDPSLKAKD